MGSREQVKAEPGKASVVAVSSAQALVLPLGRVDHFDNVDTDDTDERLVVAVVQHARQEQAESEECQESMASMGHPRIEEAP
jgi:hypothetical protein